MYRVFMVEDDRGIADAVSAHARAWDLDVRCAADFRCIMEEFADKKIDVLVSTQSLKSASMFPMPR